jgi:acyl-CoA reductase-like NAD-dependent aldehyde dehydrogenase
VKALRSADQLGLFRPRPSTPLWRDLPPETRAQVLLLLARLFRSHRRDLLGERFVRETRDE